MKTVKIILQILWTGYACPLLLLYVLVTFSSLWHNNQRLQLKEGEVDFGL